MCLCLELEGCRSLKLNVVLPSYLLPTGQETHAPSVRGLDAESPPQDPLQSPSKKKNKRGSYSERSKDRHSRADMPLLAQIYLTI